MPSKDHENFSTFRGTDHDDKDVIQYPNVAGLFEELTEATARLLHNSSTSYETSLRDNDVTPHVHLSPTENAATYYRLADPEHDVIAENSHLMKRSNGRKYGESWNSARKFVKSHNYMLSTHSTIESGADFIHAKCSNLQTLMNLIKGTTGTGILSLPLAFKNAGLWVGFVLFLVISVVAVHCMHIMNRCCGLLEKRSRVHMQNYPDTVEQSFSYGPKPLQKLAPFMRQFANGLIYVMQLGFCCIYIVWVAVNIKQVVDPFWISSPDVRMYEVAVFLLLLPYIMVKSLKTLAIFSAVANLFYLVGLIIIYQYMLQDIPDVSDRPTFNSWETLPMFFGTSIFSFESICLIVPLRSRIKREEDFGGWTGVLNLGMVVISAVYTATGFYGYLKFGDDIASTVTLNLPQYQWLYLSVNLLFAASVFISVGVQFYVPINVIWPAIDRKLSPDRSRSFRLMLQAIVRAGLMAFILAVAILVPHVDLLMSLVGSLSGTLLAIVLPVLVEMITLYEGGDLSVIIVIKDVFIFSFGMLGFATGGYSSLVDIINTF